MEDDDWFTNLDNSSPYDNMNIHFDAPIASPSYPPFRYGFWNNDPFVADDDNQVENLYLVSYRWLKEVERGRSEAGVLYNVVPNEDDDEKAISLSLKKEEDSWKGGDEGFVGQEYALISGRMWLQSLKRHNDSRHNVCQGASQYLNNSFAAEGPDVFPLQIRLSLSSETNSLIVKISLEDNNIANYRRACNIFIPKTKLLRIREFAKKITQLPMDDGMRLPNGSPGKLGGEIPLQLHVYGFNDFTNGGDKDIDGMVENDAVEDSLGMDSYSMLKDSTQSGYGYTGVGCLGLRGLQNLGNTCFMNSAIQCLGHTSELVDYFLGDYHEDINYENQLGMKGELAIAFGDLISKLWAPGVKPVAPRVFKQTLATYAPQFSGYNQHDAQEFLAFLLDGLHEDLNRVKFKPYIEVRDADGRPHKEVAEEYWQNHLARNNSIIVDLCQGQYRSTLICPACKKLSVTFDPFMHLSLPLPSTNMRVMTLTVLSSFGDTLPSPITITVPKSGSLKDLIEALSAACSLKHDETLLVGEVYKHKIFSLMEDAFGSLALIRDDDKLVAYRLPKDFRTFPLLIFTHEQVEKASEFESTKSNYKPFGIPLIGSLSPSTGLDIYKLYVKLLKPFLMPDDDALNDYDGMGVMPNEDSVLEDSFSPRLLDGDANSGCDGEDDHHFTSDFRLFLGDDEMGMGQVLNFGYSKYFVRVLWSEKMTEKYDTYHLSALPEVFKPQLYTGRSEESVTLYRCLEAFLKEEPLGPEDMWYCPNCKKHQQASKKLDLWRLPEVLVVHLKRFSYTQLFKSKLETYVDFPADDLDLSPYISHTESLVSSRYTLQAISNHYGCMGGGHYTAIINHGHHKWYEFDDDAVSLVPDGRIKTSAAYVLFYRRVT